MAGLGGREQLLAGDRPLSHLCSRVNVLQRGLEMAVDVFKGESVFLQILICRKRGRAESETGGLAPCDSKTREKHSPLTRLGSKVMATGRLRGDLGEGGTGGRPCSRVTGTHCLTATGTTASRNQQCPESSLGVGVLSATIFPVLHIPHSWASKPQAPGSPGTSTTISSFCLLQGHPGDPALHSALFRTCILPAASQPPTGQDFSPGFR